MVRRLKWLYRNRDYWLLIFLFTTYLFAPVIGFGWVLAIMGISQTEDQHTNIRMCYLMAFLFLHAYRIPWEKVFDIVNSSTTL